MTHRDVSFLNSAARLSCTYELNSGSDLGTNSKLLSLKINAADFHDMEVRREWKNIDIFLVSEANKSSFIIENKFNSTQGKTQLKDYRDEVTKYYESQKGGEQYSITGIFLTLKDEPPNDNEYLSIRYSDICELLKRTIRFKGLLLTDEVRVFINHYLEVITESTDMNDTQNDMQRLAKQLYQEHKRAIDYIVEHGAGSEFALAVDNIIGDNVKEFNDVEISKIEFVYYKSNNKQLVLLPKAWYEKLGGEQGRANWTGCENWWAGFPLMVWIQLIEDSKVGAGKRTPGKLWLYAELGPLSDHDMRKKFLETIGEKAKDTPKINFRTSAGNVNTKYSKFFTQNALDVQDITDINEIKQKIEKMLGDFQPEFSAVTEAIENALSPVIEM